MLDRTLSAPTPPLAVLGGEPAFPRPLHVGRPNVGDRERFLARVEKILDSAWFTNDGPYVRDLEARFAERVGARHAVAVCNATVALELVTRALDMRGEVIVPAWTFVATAHALQWQEVRPVFADVDPATHNLDPASVEPLITPNTTGIVGVHVWGRPCAVEALTELAERRGLQLVFDAAHALGCTHGGRPIGSFGRAEVFSLHATKVVNSFEGGVVTTDDDALAEKLRLMRNFGFAGKDRVVYLGSNGKLSEIGAAMGLTSLEGLDGFVAANERNYARYDAGLRAAAGVDLLRYDADGERNNHQYVVAEVDADRAGLTRDELVAVLEAEGCLARRYFHPGVHRMEPYASLQPTAHFVLPNTERLAGRVLALPTGTGITPEQIDRVCAIVAAALAEPARVRAALDAR